MYRGVAARSGAVRSREVGTTSKSNEEIRHYYAIYLAKHPTYKLLGAECQDFVYHLVKWMVGSVATLPAREVGQVAGAAMNGVGQLSPAVGGVGLLAAACWLYHSSY